MAGENDIPSVEGLKEREMDEQLPQERTKIADPVTTENARLKEAVEIAWGIIANAGGSDWTRETEEWQKAAARWRDEFYFVRPAS